jgi:hypothetical protein
MRSFEENLGDKDKKPTQKVSIEMIGWQIYSLIVS